MVSESFAALWHAGNGRAGFPAIGLFVAVNGYESVVEPTGAVETIFGIAEGNLPESQLAVGIRSHTKHER